MVLDCKKLAEYGWVSGHTLSTAKPSGRHCLVTALPWTLSSHQTHQRDKVPNPPQPTRNKKTQRLTRLAQMAKTTYQTCLPIMDWPSTPICFYSKRLTFQCSLRWPRMTWKKLEFKRLGPERNFFFWPAGFVRYGPYFGIRVRIMKRRVRMVVVEVVVVCILKYVLSLLLLLLLQSLPGTS